MATKLGTLTLDLVAKIGNFTGPLNQAERQATDSTNKMNKAFSSFKDQMNQSLSGTQFGSAIDGIVGKLSGLEGGILNATAAAAGIAVGGTALAIGGLAKLSIEAAKADAQMAMLATRAKIGIETFQIFTYAAEQLGISQDQLGSIFADVQEKLGEFSATGGGGAADFFDALKNNTKLTDDQIKAFSKTLQGKDGVEAVQLLKDKLDSLGASSQEQRFVFESLASDLGNLMPLFSDGGTKVEEYGKALQDAGVIKSNEAIQQSQILAAQTQAVNLQFQGVKSELVQGFMPAMTSVAEAMFSSSKEGVKLQSVGEGLGNILLWVGKTAIGVSTTVQLLGDGLGGLIAISVEAAQGNFKEAAAIYRDSQSQFDKITADGAARLEQLSKVASGSSSKLTEAILQLNQAQVDQTTGLKINTKEADENAKAKEKAAAATAKLNKELQVNAKVQANADKFGFASLESQYKLPNGLLSAINMQESRGNANAIGPMTKYGQAKGGFQFLDGTAKRFGLVGDAVFNTGKSAEAAAKYFSFLYEKFGTWEKAISAYHAGEGNVERGTGLGPINREYVKNVMGYMDSALKGIGSTASDAVRYVEDAYKAQQSIVAKYMTEREQLEAENAAAIQEIQKAFIETDPNRQKYLDLQQAVYSQNLKDFTKNERLKREEAWRTLDEIQSSMMASRVNSLAAASMNPDQLAAWQRTNIQQDGFSQLGDDFNNGVSAIDQNEFLTQEQKNAELLALHESYLSAKNALTLQYANEESEVIKQLHEQQLSAYSSLLGQASTVWGSMTQMVKDSAGEQSGAYKAMFLMQQSFAIASAIVSAHLSAVQVAADATIPFFGAKVLASKAILAMGYANAGMIAGQTIAGMAHNGIDNIPSEGTWLLDGGERVLNPEQNKDLTRYLNDRKGSGGKGVNVIINVPSGYTANESRDANGNVTIDVVEKMIKKSWTNMGQPNSFESKQVQRNFNTSVKR